MAKEFKLPDLGEGIHEAQVINVMVSEGDSIEADQMIMEVETDKAAVELPVPFGGVISSLNVKTGDTVIVGQVLLTVGGAAGGETAAPQAAAAAPTAGPATHAEPVRSKTEAQAQAPASALTSTVCAGPRSMTGRFRKGFLM